MSILSNYEAQVQSLLDDAGAVEYTIPQLDSFINDARLQIAGAAECIRFLGTLTLNPGQQAYNFGAIGSLPTGVLNVISVRKGNVEGPGGWTEVFNREWEWFFSYCLCGPLAATAGVPNTFSQLPPGVGGSIYYSPIPEGDYAAKFDCVGLPAALTDVSAVEPIPYPWTEAVQYYAAYLAYLNAQRTTDADKMLQRYTLFEQRGTQMSTPTALPVNYPGGAGATVAGRHQPITAPRATGAGGA